VEALSEVTTNTVGPRMAHLFAARLKAAVTRVVTCFLENTRHGASKPKPARQYAAAHAPPLGDVLEPLKRRELRQAVPAEPQVFILLDRLGYTGLRPPVSVNAFSRLMRL